MGERVCAYCGRPLPADARRNRRFCSRAHKREALRQRRKREEIHERLVTRSPLYADASLSELHERVRPGLVQGDEDFVVPAEVLPDEFGYTDGLVDDEPGSENAAWTIRQKMEQETNAIRARYTADIKRWTTVYARNPGPAPKLTEIMRKMNAEIREIERRYYLQEARELAAADVSSGRAAIRAQERQTAIRNLNDFGRDIRGSRFEPVQVSKPTSEIFQFPEQSSVFGSDTEVFRKSGVAQKMHNSNPYSGDGWVY